MLRDEASTLPVAGRSMLARLAGSVAGQAALVLAVKMLGAVLLFAMSLLITRSYGAAGTGVFGLAWSIAGAGAVFGRMGLDVSGMKFSSIAWAEQDGAALSDLRRKTLGLALSASAAISVTTIALAGWAAANLFHDGTLAPAIRAMSLAVPALSLVLIDAYLLRGIRRPIAGAFVEFVGIPAMVCLGIVAFGDGGAIRAVWAAVAAAGATAVLAEAYWARVRVRGAGVRRFSRGEILRVSLPLAWTNVMHLVLPSAGTIMLAFWWPTDEVGVYVAVLRVAAVMPLLLVAIGSVVAPRFATLWNEGRTDEIERLAKASSALLVCVALPLLLGIIAFPTQILSVFGDGFGRGKPALIAISIGQFVNVATGSVGYILAMTGHERTQTRILSAWTAAQIALNAALIPAWGVHGAGIAYGVVLAGVNVGLLWGVWRRLHIVALPTFETWRDLGGLLGVLIKQLRAGPVAPVEHVSKQGDIQ